MKSCIVIERNELSEKLTKLKNSFFGSRFSELPISEQILLTNQSRHMAAYLLILDQRIKLSSVAS